MMSKVDVKLLHGSPVISRQHELGGDVGGWRVGFAARFRDGARWWRELWCWLSRMKLGVYVDD